MSYARECDRLSWGDALFLYLEREGMPLNIGSVSIFEGAISLVKCRQFVESKLPLIPRYRQRVVSPPFNIGLPLWEYDSEFDIRYHVRQVNLKRGTLAELKATVGRIFSQVMDRKRPLWDIILIRGLSGNRTAVVSRAHHCLADGIAGVGLMNVIMDPKPNAYVASSSSRPFRAPRSRDPLTSMVDGLLGSYSNLVDRFLTAQSDLLSIAQKLLAGSQNSPRTELSKLLPELTVPTERLRFNVNCRGPQKFVWAEIPLEDVKAVRKVCEATVNDVVLSIVTATIRRYVEMHGDPVKRRLLRMMVPVNVRNGRSSDLGNRISLLPVTVPMDIRNPKRLIRAVARRTEFLKRAPVAEFVSLAGNLVSTTPTALQTIAGPIASELPLTVFNLVCTNVPGPAFPLYLLGHKMLNWYPYVPIGGEMALNCAILSYNGMVYFGFAGDVHAVPDLGTVEKLLKLSIKELQQILRPSRAAKRRPRRPRTESAIRPSIIKAVSVSPEVIGESGPTPVRPINQTATMQPIAAD